MAPQEALQSNHDCVDQAEDAAKIQPPTASSSRKKSLVFRNFVEVRWIPNLDDYTEMGLPVYSMWYSQFEYQLMRNECLETISNMRENIPEDDSNCYRGFEWKAKGAPTRRKAIRKRARNAVFSVQDRQWDADAYKYNPEAIAAAYSSDTGCCNFEAFRRGLEDAEQVHGFTIRYETNK
jgi:hypothetical protein